MKNVRFVKWLVDSRPTKTGDKLVKGMFEDEEGNKYDWVPKTADLQEGVGWVNCVSTTNKMSRKE